ncbi:MAG: hypothetical protein MJ249_00835 [Kiritimatiellae bacterium]|nr:hypothetical protein [Kiritimatiellia bacterium]
MKMKAFSKFLLSVVLAVGGVFVASAAEVFYDGGREIVKGITGAATIEPGIMYCNTYKKIPTGPNYLCLDSGVVAAVKKLADEKNIPVILIGSSTGCTFCDQFMTSVLLNGNFISWVSKSGYLFVHVTANLGNWGSAEPKAFANMVGTLTGYPMVSGYWKKKDGTVIDPTKGGITFPGRGYSWDYYTKFFDKLFAGYSPDASDDHDPADDVPSGATVLVVTENAAVTPQHTLDATGSDKIDWMAMSVEKGKKYRLAISELKEDAGSFTCTVSNAVTKSVTSMPAAQLVQTPYVFTAAETGKMYISLSAATASSSGSYKLEYREYQDVVFAFAEKALSVKENEGTAKLVLTREGRLTDAVSAVVYTTGGTAVDGVNYTGVSNLVTFAADKVEAEIAVPIADIAGTQGEKAFTVTAVNQEDAANTETATVTIGDLDKPTDAADPADDTRATATVLPMTDDEASVKDRVLSGEDAADWYKFQTLTAGSIYQLKVTDYAKRPADAASDPTIALYYGTSTEPFTNLTMKALSTVRFTAAESADLVVGVLNEEVPPNGGVSTVYTYSLAWREWTLPVVSFETNELAVASLKGGSQPVPIRLIRSKNLDEEVTVDVEIASPDLRVVAMTNKVTFAAGAETASLTLRVREDDGTWKPDVDIPLTILIDEKAPVSQAVESTILTLTVKLSTSMPEFDEWDGEDNTNGSALNATALPLDEETGKTPRRPMAVAATLNGTDKADYYSFPVEKGVEYAVQIVDLLPDAATAVKVFVQAPGEAGESEIALEACTAAPYRFKANADGKFAVIVKKTSDELVSIQYGVKYREWVPATISFVTGSVEVSEFASSVRVGVKCDMDVPLPTSVKVVTEDGTAKAGEDYVAAQQVLEWDESASTSSVKYATIDLKKLTAEYEGTSEDFKIKLDFTDSEALEGALTEMTVTILESDVGAVGTFVIDGYRQNETEYPYQVSALTVTAGTTVPVKVVRTGGNAGAVTVTLAWKDKTGSYTAEMADLETETWVNVEVPVSDGVCLSRQTKALTLTVSDKKAKTANATMNFLIADDDQLLSTYAVDRANVGFSTAANGWYLAGTSGTLRTKTLTAAKQTAVMSASLKGEGQLVFRSKVTGAGDLVVKVKGLVADVQSLSDGLKSVAIPKGVASVQFVFTATAANSWAEIDDVSFTPGGTFFQTGTFFGEALKDGIGGTAKFSVSSTGRLSGRLVFPGNVSWVISGALTEGASSDVMIQRGSERSKAAKVTISESGELQFFVDDAGITAAAEATRDGWCDRPLVGVFAENEDLGSQTLDYVDEAKELTLTVKTSANGTMRASGKVGTRRVSASSTAYWAGSSFRAAFNLAGLENALVLEFTRTEVEGNQKWMVSVVEADAH